MKQKQFFLASLTILLISLLFTACNKSPRHLASVGASGLSVVTLEGEKLTEQLYNTTYTDTSTGNTDHFISKQEAGDAVQAIDKLTSANDVFIAHVRALPVVDAGNKSQVILYFNELVAAASEFQATQKPFKNPDAQKQFALWSQTIPVALSTIESIIGAVGSKSQPSLTGEQLATKIAGRANP